MGCFKHKIQLVHSGSFSSQIIRRAWREEVSGTASLQFWNSNVQSNYDAGCTTTLSSQVNTCVHRRGEIVGNKSSDLSRLKWHCKPTTASIGIVNRILSKFRSYFQGFTTFLVHSWNQSFGSKDRVVQGGSDTFVTWIGRCFLTLLTKKRVSKNQTMT